MSSCVGAWLPAGLNPPVISMKRLKCLHLLSLWCGSMITFAIINEFGKQTTNPNAPILASFVILRYVCRGPVSVRIQSAERFLN